jgi:hypothetical protein
MKTKPHPIVNLEGDITMISVIVELVVLLSMEKTFTDIVKELIMVPEQCVDGLNLCSSCLVRAKGRWFPSKHHLEWCVAQG